MLDFNQEFVVFLKWGRFIYFLMYLTCLKLNWHFTILNTYSTLDLIQDNFLFFFFGLELIFTCLDHLSEIQ
ncbi:MAG: hypothetical protein PHO80_04375 [Candidatus Gracilibacteria bacterium]|nr:hypothetical protein [Candidatus Gracilibacteria bacterium]MDD4530753.1 hypothetical protein [Candidatus Gracilibacteria bacterium]